MQRGWYLIESFQTKASIYINVAGIPTTTITTTITSNCIELRRLRSYPISTGSPRFSNEKEINFFFSISLMTADNDIVSKSNEFFSTDMAASSSPSPSSASPIQNSAARIEKYLATATSVYKSSRTHPRYHARIYSLSAIAAGILLNFLSFIAALFERYENAPIVVVVWVGFVVSFSFVLSFFPFVFVWGR